MTIHLGDCIDVMATLDAESIDAIVTDPPYGIGFMGKAWDGPAIAQAAARDAATRKSVGPASASRPGRATARSSSAFGSAAHYAGPVSGGRPWQEWCEQWARAAYRVAKPGAYLLAFGGTRTVHRMTCAIEDAGWEIRDMLVWAYASGFPKSLDVSKAMDRAAGAERKVVGSKLGRPGMAKDGSNQRSGFDAAYDGSGGTPMSVAITAPATLEARKWQGWGTALKPAWEPIVMARKPLRGTVADNVERYGTGALNIDGCRIGTESVGYVQPRPTIDANGSLWGKGEHVPFHYSRKGEASASRRYVDEPGDFAALPGPRGGDARGRWPANVVLTDPIFDGGWDGVVGGGPSESGIAVTRNGGGRGIFSGIGDGVLSGEAVPDSGYGDSGTYSRFFLIPKAARSDREPVLGGLPLRAFGQSGGAQAAMARGEEYQSDGASTGLNVVKHRANVHPTVKPTDLMRHLVRLVTPPGGTVLDPFLGSGTTALAAEAEGVKWIGIEREAEYAAIAEARLNGTQRGLCLGA